MAGLNITGTDFRYAAAESNSSGETFIYDNASVGESPPEIDTNSALLFLVGSGELKIENSGSTSASIIVGSNTLMISGGKSITIGSGSTLFLGGYDAMLTNNGLNNGEPTETTYDTIDALAAGGPGTLTVNSNMILDGNTVIHIGRTSKNDDGQSTPTTYVDSLTVSDYIYTFKDTRLNIGSNGAAGDCSVICSGASGDVTVSGCTINVGGGAGGVGRATSGGAGGAGGKGELTISADISGSRIYCGSGGGGGAAWGGGGGVGGAGTVMVSSMIIGSYIFTGAAGGGAGAAGGGGAGGLGTLIVSSGVTNSIIFVGSSGGGGGDSGSTGAAGGGAGGAGGSGNNGGSGILTISGSTNQITNKIVSFGSPSSTGADINQNIKTGVISNSVVFIGCGNYGSISKGDAGGAGGGAGGGGGVGGVGGAGANVSLAYDLHGYLGQQLPFSFAGMSPNLPKLGDQSQQLLDGTYSFLTAKANGLDPSWTTGSAASVGMTYDLSKYPSSQQVYPFNGYNGTSATYEIWNDYYTFSGPILTINPSKALTTDISAKTEGTLMIDDTNDIIQQTNSSKAFEYNGNYAEVSKAYIYKSNMSYPFVFDCKNFTLENGGKIKMVYVNGDSFSLSNSSENMTKITSGETATGGATFTANSKDTKLNGCEVCEDVMAYTGMPGDMSFNSVTFSNIKFNHSGATFKCSGGFNLEFASLTSIGNMVIENSSGSNSKSVSLKNLTGTIPSVIDTENAVDIDGLNINGDFTTLTFANNGKASFDGKMTVGTTEKILKLSVSGVDGERTVKIGSNNYLELSDQIDNTLTTLANSIDATMPNKYKFENDVADTKNLVVSNTNGTKLRTSLSSIASGVTITSNGTSMIASSSINANYNSLGTVYAITYDKDTQENLDKVILTKDSSDTFNQKQLTVSKPSGAYSLTVIFDGSIAVIPQLSLSANTTIIIRNNTFKTDREITIPSSSEFRIGDQEFTTTSAGSLKFAANTVYTFIGENTNEISANTDALTLYYNNISLIDTTNKIFTIPAGTTLTNIVASIPGTNPEKVLKIYGSATFNKDVSWNGSLSVDVNASVEFDYSNSGDYTITGALTVIGDSTLSFIDSTTFNDTSFVNCVFAKPLKYSSGGKAQFINVNIDNAKNKQLSILNECLVCSSSNASSVLKYVNDVTFGKLFINPGAGLFINNSSAMTFNGTLKVNRITYLSGTAPLSYSGSDLTNMIIFNSENYASESSPFIGTILFEASASGCVLQINPSGRITLQNGSIFSVGGASTNVVVNGTFESLMDNKTYAYNKSARLNGIMKVGVDFTSLGNIQLDSNGSLYIGAEAEREEGAEEGAEPASVFFGLNSDVNIGGSLTILGNFYNNGKLTVNDSFTVIPKAHFQNEGTTMIKKATENGLVLNGSLILASGAKYIGNGSLVTDQSSRITVQSGGECVVNGSLTMGSDSNILVKGGQAGLQVAFNGDISTGTNSYIFDSQATSKESIKINIDADLETKSQH